MAGFQEYFLNQLRFILGDCHTANIFRMSSTVSAQMQGGKNESMSSHNSALQCEPQIVYYSLLGKDQLTV